VRRRAQHLSDGSAFDNSASIHDRDRIGDLGGDAKIVRDEGEDVLAMPARALRDLRGGLVAMGGPRRLKVGPSTGVRRIWRG
jgi:hypothetical protein